MKSNELYSLRDAASGKVARHSPTVLVVDPVEVDYSQDSILGQLPWRTDCVRSCLEAILYLHRSIPRVVVCERDLPDGSWKDILQLTAPLDSPPVIVTSRLADDHLWAEVLNLGGYDVLRKPLNKEEVSRSVSLAWEHWANQRDSAQRAKAAHAAKGGLQVCLTA
jgi:DNA-binding NtrC family response regulator